MAERILAENKHVQTVSYSLPNKHYIPVDMRYAGIDNLTPYVLRFLCAIQFALFPPLGHSRAPLRSPHAPASLLLYSRRTSNQARLDALHPKWCVRFASIGRIRPF